MRVRVIIFTLEEREKETGNRYLFGRIRSLYGESLLLFAVDWFIARSNISDAKKKKKDRKGAFDGEIVRDKILSRRRKEKEEERGRGKESTRESIMTKIFRNKIRLCILVRHACNLTA